MIEYYKWNTLEYIYIYIYTFKYYKWNPYALKNYLLQDEF